MTRILAVLGSGRANGYTAGLLHAAVKGAESVEGVEVELVHLHRYVIRPCTSCFRCIRQPGGGCILDDEMGRKTDGSLYQKVRNATGFLLGDAVHNWTVTAAMRLFIERLYPFGWTGELSGSYFASISCASNSGMHREAARLLCQESFCRGFHYVGGLAVHAAQLPQALEDANDLGAKLGRACLKGRQAVNDESLWSEYAGQMWHVYPQYLDNLTNGTLDYEQSLPALAVRDGVFRNPDARDLLNRAADGLRDVLRLHKLGDRQSAQKQLVRVATLWVQATWKEFVEVITGAGAPEAYHPLDE